MPTSRKVRSRSAHPGRHVPECHGFIIESRRAPSAETARHIRRLMTQQLGGRWRVSQLGAGARDFLCEPADQRQLDIAAAWDLVYALRQDPSCADAEPALWCAGLEPHRPATPTLLTPVEFAGAKSAWHNRHLAGAASPNWALKQTRIDRAWRLALPPGGRRFGAGIVVAAPDTGYTTHPEIWRNPAGRQRLDWERGANFVERGTRPRDRLSGSHAAHGTKTASLIMSDPGPIARGGWVSGAAPAATVVPYRVLESVVVWNFSRVAEAIYAAIDAGCHIISLSLGGVIAFGSLRRAVTTAVRAGVIVLAAAGNTWPFVVYPARLPEVIAVGAVNCEGAPWMGSARGPQVDVSAPGESVWVARTRPGQRFDITRGHGTSFAVATVGGAAALWLAHHGRRRLLERFGREHLAGAFRQVLVTHGIRTPRGWRRRQHGAGILDAERLLSAPLPRAAPRPRQSSAPTGAARVADNIHAYLPDASASAVRSTLLGWYGGDARALADTGDELTSRVATDAAVRGAVARRRRRCARRFRDTCSERLRGALS